MLLAIGLPARPRLAAVFDRETGPRSNTLSGKTGSSSEVGEEYHARVMGPESLATRALGAAQGAGFLGHHPAA